MMENNKISTVLNEMAELLEPAVSSGARSNSIASRPVLPHLIRKTEDAQRLRNWARIILDGQSNLLIVGSFNSGKSALVNALLGAEVVLTGAVPTTAVSTHLYKNTASNIVVYPRAGSPYSIERSDYAKYYNISVSNPDNSSDVHELSEDSWAAIDHIEISGPFPQMLEGTTIIDTPGLAENQSRTKLALEYLPYAEAIVVVIDSKRPLAKEERDFIALLGLNSFNNVFFAVNRIDLLSEQGIADVKALVRKRLASRFTHREGHFDEELYRKRVFFVSALQANEAFSDQGESSFMPLSRAHSATNAPEANLEDDGMVAMRSHLTEWLNQSRQNSSVAQLQPLIPVLADIVYCAHQQMARRIDALKQPAATLETKLAESERRLAQMKQATESIQMRIADATTVVKHHAYSNLIQYVLSMKDTWTQDAEMLDLEQLSNINIFSVSFSQKDKNRLGDLLLHELQRYMQMKLIQWARQLPEALRSSLNDLLEDIHHDLRCFQFELDDIDSLMNKRHTERSTARSLPLSQGSDHLYSDLFNTRMILQLVRPTADKLLADLSTDSNLKKFALTTIGVICKLGVGGEGTQLFVTMLFLLGKDLVRANSERRCVCSSIYR